MGFLMPPHPLTVYQNEPRFNGVFSKNNLPEKIKNGAYVIDLDEYADDEYVTKMKLFILIVLVFNMFLKRLRNLLGTKT